MAKLDKSHPNYSFWNDVTRKLYFIGKLETMARRHQIKADDVFINKEDALTLFYVAIGNTLRIKIQDS